jgi:hypothetical protein
VGVDGGALVGVNAAAEEELVTRAPVRDGEAVTEACCITIGWWRRGTDARKQAAARAAAVESA